MSLKIRSQKKLEKPCTNCFNPQYLKFNFSYTNDINGLDMRCKAQLTDAMMRLSDATFLTVCQRPKEKGLEILDKNKLHLRKEYPESFIKRFPASTFNNKVSIFRLYPNDNPILGRIIGAIIKNVFYVFFIDIGGNLYNH